MNNEKGIKALLSAAKEFVRRVELGEVKSRKSYKQFKEAIEVCETENCEQSFLGVMLAIESNIYAEFSYINKIDFKVIGSLLEISIDADGPLKPILNSIDDFCNAWPGRVVYSIEDAKFQKYFRNV